MGGANPVEFAGPGLWQFILLHGRLAVDDVSSSGVFGLHPGSAVRLHLVVLVLCGYACTPRASVGSGVPQDGARLRVQVSDGAEYRIATISDDLGPGLSVGRIRVTSRALYRVRKGAMSVRYEHLSVDKQADDGSFEPDEELTRAVASTTPTIVDASRRVHAAPIGDLETRARRFPASSLMAGEVPLPASPVHAGHRYALQDLGASLDGTTIEPTSVHCVVEALDQANATIVCSTEIQFDGTTKARKRIRVRARISRSDGIAGRRVVDEEFFVRGANGSRRQQTVIVVTRKK